MTQRLRADLRTARNLAILTPFQKSTRDRVSSSIGPLAQRIRHERLYLSRLLSYVSTLQNEHNREMRERARLEYVALQAAAESLRDEPTRRSIIGRTNEDDEPDRAISMSSSSILLDENHLEDLSDGIRKTSDDSIRRPDTSRRVSSSSYSSIPRLVTEATPHSSSDLLSEMVLRTHNQKGDGPDQQDIESTREILIES